MKHAALCCSLVAAGSIAFAASPTSPRHELSAEVSRSGLSRPALTQLRRDHRDLPRPARRIPHCPLLAGGSTDDEANQW